MICTFVRTWLCICAIWCVCGVFFLGQICTLSWWLAVGANALDTASSHSLPDWSMSLSVLLSFPRHHSLHLPSPKISIKTKYIIKTIRFRGGKCVCICMHWYTGTVLWWHYSLLLIVLIQLLEICNHAGINRLQALSCQPPTNGLCATATWHLHSLRVMM